MRILLAGASLVLLATATPALADGRGNGGGRDGPSRSLGSSFGSGGFSNHLGNAIRGFWGGGFFSPRGFFPGNHWGWGNGNHWGWGNGNHWGWGNGNHWGWGNGHGNGHGHGWGHGGGHGHGHGHGHDDCPPVSP